MGPHMKLTKRVVDNPLYTDGLKFAPQAKPRRGSVVFTTERPKQQTPARITVEENIISRIGALCFIRKREAHHEQAAERFKNHYELAYGAGNPVGDPGRVQVDTSKVAHDSGIIAKIAHASKIKQAETGLGKEAFNRLVAVVILEIPCGDGLHWRSRSGMVDLVLSDLDALSVLWELSSSSARGLIGGTRLEPAA
jgi:hypothetical protein